MDEPHLNATASVALLSTTMTYNFDPDKWYDNELDVLRARRRAGQITREQFQGAAARLDQRYQEMWDRLDGSYQLPVAEAGDPP
jgi:hypothetical protein